MTAIRAMKNLPMGIGHPAKCHLEERGLSGGQALAMRRVRLRFPLDITASLRQLEVLARELHPWDSQGSRYAVGVMWTVELREGRLLNRIVRDKPPTIRIESDSVPQVAMRAGEHEA